jgi:pimeloyl-ACP methyl ester carboxylesterase
VSAAVVPVAALVVLYLLGLALWRRHLLPTPCDERHTAPTRDGWGLALYRYRPAAGGSAEPVLLCHGLLSNRFNVDLDERHSLARHLRRAGFDAWVMELRGHGGSRRLAGNRDRPRDWSIDEYVRLDLPAAVDYVNRNTGGRGVHWVGHSLGGMILYAACALDLAPAIRSAVLADAHADFRPLRGRRALARLCALLAPAAPPALLVPFALVLGRLSPSVLLARFGIRSRRALLDLVANGVAGLGSARVADHLARVLDEGRFVSFDGRIDYEAGIGRIHFPVLQLAAADRLSPEGVARSLVERAPAGLGEYLRLGRGEGYSEEYTHFTVLLGENAPREVFPRIADFLRRHRLTGRSIEDRLPSTST